VPDPAQGFPDHRLHRQPELVLWAAKHVDLVLDISASAARTCTLLLNITNDLIATEHLASGMRNAKLNMEMKKL
jgi:hypothetical protein